MIVEGVLLLDVLEQIGRSPEFLIYIQREDENEDRDISDFHKSLIDYRLRRKPEQRGNFILPAAMITWCPLARSLWLGLIDARFEWRGHDPMTA